MHATQSHHATVAPADETCVTGADMNGNSAYACAGADEYGSYYQEGAADAYGNTYDYYEG
ncbi:hypothetical protein ACWGDT_36775 [Streptomyces avermitilis]